MVAAVLVVLMVVNGCCIVMVVAETAALHQVDVIVLLAVTSYSIIISSIQPV